MLRLTATLALAALALTGRASSPPAGPAAAPQPSSSAPSESPSPEVEEQSPAELVVRGWGVEILDEESDVMASFVWADAPDDALAILEMAFGPAPDPYIEPGDGTHIADFESYDFGGLIYQTALIENHREDYFLPSVLRITASGPLNGVRLAAPGGLAPGDSLDSALALEPTDRRDYFPEGHEALLFDPVDPASFGEEAGGTDTVAALVDPSGIIVELRAPFPSSVGF